ncbi:MAG: tRNA pseudouridine(38-40) synthase TruA [Syntrophomonadaceae bacterium]|nr:tRNA pseudouridine(38-40) synthase TruA [Syntrophomonadaceae bacterium]
MPRIKMIVEYDGTNYHGFQRQANAHTVQAEIEKRIRQLTGESLTVSGASRTDTGVHARGQVIVFDTASPIPAERWSSALNGYLPVDIRVLGSEVVADDFHPAFAARQKTYYYRIWRERPGSAMQRQRALLCYEDLDEEAMIRAAAGFVGRHDFQAFCSSGATTRTSERTITRCDVERHGPLLVMYITANGFLYNMVRIIVGTLLEVGRGRIAPDMIPEIIASRDRARAGPTAPPQGLYLLQVEYGDVTQEKA